MFGILTTINKGGRSPKLSPKSKIVARRLITTEAVENAVQANKCLDDNYQINVSNDTVRRCLKNLGRHDSKNNLVNSIPTRIKLVIKAKQGHAKY